MFLTRCPRCEHIHPADPETDESAGTEYWLQHILDFCGERGIKTGLDGRVSEKHAALILGRSPLTLRNRRLGNCPIPSANHNGRVQYRLIDLARYLATAWPCDQPY